MTAALAGFFTALDALHDVERGLARGEFMADAAAQSKAVHTRLAELLQAQKKQAEQAPTEAEREILAAGVYTSAAVLDEALAIRCDWPGRAEWPGQLLEQRLFQSRLAGQHFFDAAERVLRSDRQHAGWRSLAAVHLLALRAGFEGQHRGSHQGRTAIAALQARLHDFSCGTQPADPQLCPQAHQHTQVLMPPVRLSRRRPWRVGLGLLAAWLLISGPWWQALVQDLAVH
ncbi:DotU family type IV/VI secretion system protein [Burkholderiaceae bacterium UC74_6]